MAVRFTKPPDRVLQELKNASGDKLRELADTMNEHAKAQPGAVPKSDDSGARGQSGGMPVDTGHMRDSSRVKEVDSLHYELGTEGAGYAAHQYFGTQYLTGDFWYQRAFEQAKEEVMRGPFV